jgi:hypothetical protein
MYSVARFSDFRAELGIERAKKGKEQAWQSGEMETNQTY